MNEIEYVTAHVKILFSLDTNQIWIYSDCKNSYIEVYVIGLWFNYEKDEFIELILLSNNVS